MCAWLSIAWDRDQARPDVDAAGFPGQELSMFLGIVSLSSIYIRDSTFIVTSSIEQWLCLLYTRNTTISLYNL